MACPTDGFSRARSRLLQARTESELGADGTTAPPLFQVARRRCRYTIDGIRPPPRCHIVRVPPKTLQNGLCVLGLTCVQGAIRELAPSELHERLKVVVPVPAPITREFRRETKNGSHQFTLFRVRWAVVRHKLFDQVPVFIVHLWHGVSFTLSRAPSRRPSTRGHEPVSGRGSGSGCPRCHTRRLEVRPRESASR